MKKVLYDLHIHSALSPCAENDMTPVNVVAKASAEGLEIIAVSDHNSIANVEAATEVGRALGVVVVPAIELQTAEDVHILCLFESVENLKGFYDEIKFRDVKNKPSVFGDQLIVSSDDEVVGVEERLLLSGADISEPEVKPLAEKYGGVAVPAHVNRDANGIVAILGDVPNYYTAVELSTDCDEETAQKFAKRFNIVFDSDSHELEKIGGEKKFLKLNDIDAKEVLSYLRGE